MGFFSSKSKGPSGYSARSTAEEVTQGIHGTGLTTIVTGVIPTNSLRHHTYMQDIARLIAKLVFKTITEGAATTCYVALHPQVEGLSGEYFVDCNKAKPSSQATDAELAKKLWDFSMSLTNSNS